MDKLLLTDTDEVFESSNLANKILFRYHLPSVLLNSTIHSTTEIAKLNDDFFIDFLKNGDRIRNKLEECANQINEIRIPLKYISEYEWKIGLCHSLLEEDFEKRILLEDLVEMFSSKYECEISLAHRAKKAEKRKLQFYKNRLYFLFDLKRKFITKRSFDYVYMITNAPHHFELLKGVMKNQVSDGDTVAMVIYPTSMGDTQKSLKHLPDGVEVYEIQQFRGYPKFSLERRKWEDFGLLNFDAVEANYTLMINMLDVLSPKVCITMGYQNHTRFLAQTCTHLKIPCVSIDYSFITDDYRFERSIRYDHRISISKAQVDLWQKRNDPSSKHHSIGYLKYDEIRNIKFDRHLFEEKVGFQFSETLLFASSYGFDRKIKQDLIRYLSDYCHTNGMNLLIKKHPLETDTIPNETVKNKGHASQAVFEHNELSALEAICYSDLVISQGSSIVLDALYFSKPFITFSTGNHSITDLMPLGHEPFLLSASTFAELSKAIEAGLKTQRGELIDAIERKKGHYLGQIDGESSLCLQNILMEIKSGM